MVLSGLDSHFIQYTESSHIHASVLPYSWNEASNCREMKESSNKANAIIYMSPLFPLSVPALRFYVGKRRSQLTLRQRCYFFCTSASMTNMSSAALHITFLGLRSETTYNSFSYSPSVEVGEKPRLCIYFAISLSVAKRALGINGCMKTG